jgi:hypothetical protein
MAEDDMGLLEQRNPPNLPLAPAEYDAQYMNLLSNAIRLFFNNINSIQKISTAGLNINVDTLPTQVSLATLRSGDVYRDTSAGNVLKVKP